MAHAWKACWVKALGGSNPPSSADAKRAHPQGGRVLHLLQCSGFGEEQRRSRCDGVPHPARLREGGAPRGGAFFSCADDHGDKERSLGRAPSRSPQGSKSPTLGPCAARFM